jgi:hypothetical protein
LLFRPHAQLLMHCCGSIAFNLRRRQLRLRRLGPRPYFRARLSGHVGNCTADPVRTASQLRPSGKSWEASAWGGSADAWMEIGSVVCCRGHVSPEMYRLAARASLSALRSRTYVPMR